MAKRMKKVPTRWEIWTYDVWGNAKDGYDVNDRSCIFRDYPIDIVPTLYNAGTPHEFISAHPTDKQIREAFGLSPIRLDLDGDDINIYVSRERDGYPIGEMRCISHAHLSPVRALDSEEITVPS